jgi:hypothetical protein
VSTAWATPSHIQTCRAWCRLWWRDAKLRCKGCSPQLHPAPTCILHSGMSRHQRPAAVGSFSLQPHQPAARRLWNLLLLPLLLLLLQMRLKAVCQLLLRGATSTQQPTQGSSSSSPTWLRPHQALPALQARQQVSGCSCRGGGSRQQQLQQLPGSARGCLQSARCCCCCCCCCCWCCCGRWG